MPTPTNTQFAVAVHVLTYLSNERVTGRPVSSDELAESANVNPVHVRRVLGPLREAGLVDSQPGARGGWRLVADPKVVTLADVWGLLQGADPVLGLHGPNPRCPVGRGIQHTLGQVERQVAAAMEAELGRQTLADVVRLALTDPGEGLGQRREQVPHRRHHR